MVILMVWVFATAFILILSAEICSVFARMRRGVEREGLNAATGNGKPPIT